MDTITQLLFATFIPAQPFVMTSTTISASTAMSTTASVVDDSDLLTTSTLGVTTTSSASLAGVKEGYDNYYQTIAYVESLSDVELAELTNEIDSITIDDAKAKVYINTPKTRS